MAHAASSYAVTPHQYESDAQTYHREQHRIPFAGLQTLHPCVAAAMLLSSRDLGVGIVNSESLLGTIVVQGGSICEQVK